MINELWAGPISLRDRMARIGSVVLALAVLLPAGSAGAQQVPTVPFNHFDTNDSRSFVLPVSAGAFFDVEISDSCKSKFTVHYTGIKAADSTANASQTTRGEVPWDCISDPKPQLIQVPHNTQYGGYIFLIEHKGETPVRVLRPAKGVTADTAAATYATALAAAQAKNDPTPEKTALAATGEVKALDNVTLVVSVTSTTWDYSLAGGFTVSWLTDPVYVSKPPEVSTAPATVFRDRGAEDSTRLGFAGFVHVYHHKIDWLALSLGLGINTGNNVTLFVGPGWRMGSKAALTAGWNFGSQKRLPGGLAEGRALTDANALASLPTRTGGNFFVALSYGFLNPGEDVFKKPFAPPTQAK